MQTSEGRTGRGGHSVELHLATAVIEMLDIGQQLAYDEHCPAVEFRRAGDRTVLTVKIVNAKTLPKVQMPNASNFIQIYPREHNDTATIANKTGGDPHERRP